MNQQREWLVEDLLDGIIHGIEQTHQHMEPKDLKAELGKMIWKIGQYIAWAKEVNMREFK